MAKQWEGEETNQFFQRVDSVEHLPHAVFCEQVRFNFRWESLGIRGLF